MWKNFKIIAMWVIAGFIFLIASMIAGNLHPGLGVNDTGLALGMIVALFLFLVGGLIWISIAVAVKKTHDV